MNVTELGISKLVRPLQSENAKTPMDVTELGMTVFIQPEISVLLAVSMMALQLPRESYLGLLPATVILVRAMQPEKGLSPMEVTELGMSMLVKPLQPENADQPIEVTELGIVMLVRSLHPKNVKEPMDVTELGMVTLLRPLHPQNE